MGAIGFAKKLVKNTALKEYLRSKTTFRLTMDGNTIQKKGAFALAVAIKEHPALVAFDICRAEVKVV